MATFLCSKCGQEYSNSDSAMKCPCCENKGQVLNKKECTCHYGSSLGGCFPVRKLIDPNCPLHGHQLKHKPTAAA